MKYKQAKEEFQYALDHQQTISISKLSKLMQSMNMSLQPTENAEVEYLKGELKRTNERLRKEKRKNK